jgi:hypothetical protein
MGCTHNDGGNGMIARFAFEAGKADGSFIRFKLELPLGWLVLGRMFFGA